MRRFFFCLLIFFAFPLFSIEPSSSLEEIKENYKKGTYRPFLTSLHEEYVRAGKAGLLAPLFQQTTQALKEHPKETLLAPSERAKALIQKRNQHLREIAIVSTQEELVKQVEAVISFLISPEEEKLLQEIDHLKFLPQEQKEAVAIENRLAAIEAQYYLKTLLLHIGHEKGQTSLSDLEQKKLILALEKFDRMEQMAQESQEDLWLDKLKTAENLITLQYEHDRNLPKLEALAAAQKEQASPTEQKIGQVMRDYLNSSQELALRESSS